jgi:4-amino-4-deoxy-L-arabinose transferase-like glycosyltransferase
MIDTIVRHPSGRERSGPPRIQPFDLVGWCDRHYRTAAAVVLALAAFNVGYRLHLEFLTDWDEALYATSAWEALTRGNWIATTYLGEIDYYNSKPPLNVWLIALTIKAFGPGLLALRLVSAASAWATVAVLVFWTRRLFGAAVALGSGIVLGTMFGFLHVHSGRSANADALFTLLILLTVVALWAAPRTRWALTALGPLLAGAFLLKGTGVMLPGIVIGTVVVIRSIVRAPGPPAAGRRGWAPIVTACVLFLAPVGAWAAARWSQDGTAFFRRMVTNDLIGITLTVQDGHSGSLFYYLNVLQKDHYDWLGAAIVAGLLTPSLRRRTGEWFRTWRSHRTGLLLAGWAGSCLLVPTIMQTKLAWYLNPFYPAFAIGVALTLVQAVTDARRGMSRVRRALLLGAIAVAFVAAESRDLWYSVARRDLTLSPQGLLLAERQRLVGRRIYASEWRPADRFVLEALVGACPATASDARDFEEKAAPGDFLVSPSEALMGRSTALVGRNSRYALYVRAGGEHDRREDCE